MGRADVMIELEMERKNPPRKIKSSNGSSTGSQSAYAHTHVTQIYEDTDLYLAAKTGSLADFQKVLSRVSSVLGASFVDSLSRLSHLGSTLIHLAAEQGKEDIVTYIASMSPSLVLIKNFYGDTALHIAARAGHGYTVKALIQINQDLLALNSQAGNGAEMDTLLRATNDRGNTALHEALIHHQEPVARYLIQQDPEITYCINKEHKSSLYLAIEAGFVNCVSLILGYVTDEEGLKRQMQGRSPIRKAILTKNRDVLEAMLNAKPSIIRLRDEEEKTPLHYAAEIGFVEEVKYLLDKYASDANQRDKSGRLPIHLASIYGHVEVVSLLLQDFPDPRELLDTYGRNILHLAAECGRCNLVSYILKDPILEMLINMKDKYGSTPLHRAAINCQPKTVIALTWDKRVNVKLANYNRMTALDAVEAGMPYNPQFRQRLTWAALKAAGTPRLLPGNYVDRRPSEKCSYGEKYKERINTLLLVSTLVATITFAAGFTMPGGYNSSGPDLGTATMLTSTAFQIFVLCDTVALFSSIISAVTLIWAQLGDLTLVLNALTLAQPLIGIALSMMSVAFTAGVYLVVRKLRWLAIFILAMATTFFTMLLLLVIPLCMPITSSNTLLRYISYYPFYLLILATSRDPKDKIE